MVGERGKWSGGRRGAFTETEPERNGPPPSHGRKLAAPAAMTNAARDERAACEKRSGANCALVTAGSPKIGIGCINRWNVGCVLQNCTYWARSLGCNRQGCCQIACCSKSFLQVRNFFCNFSKRHISLNSVISRDGGLCRRAELHHPAA